MEIKFMKTKNPTAIVYGWYKQGTEILYSDVYFEEYLHEGVQVISLPYTNNVFDDYSQHRPDLIISIGKKIEVPTYQLQQIHIHHDEPLDDNVLANIIVCQTVFRACKVMRPRFSVFTPTYKTGERILRTYESLKNKNGQIGSGL